MVGIGESERKWEGKFHRKGQKNGVFALNKVNVDQIGPEMD